MLKDVFEFEMVLKLAKLRYLTFQPSDVDLEGFDLAALFLDLGLDDRSVEDAGPDVVQRIEQSIAWSLFT